VLVPVTLAGTTLLVYTYSYLGYGQEMAAELVREHFTDDPCVLVGSNPKAKGNFRQCTERIKDSLFHKERCKSCSFAGNFQPSLKGEAFLAIENFFYTSKFFEAHDNRNFVDVLQEKGNAWCSTPYPRAQASYPSLSKDEVNKYCFASSYIPLLMTELGFSKSELETAVFVSKNINGTGIDWALGGVITYLTNAQPVQYPSLPRSRTKLLLRVMLLLSFICLFFMWFKRRGRVKVRF